MCRECYDELSTILAYLEMKTGVQAPLYTEKQAYVCEEIYDEVINKHYKKIQKN